MDLWIVVTLAAAAVQTVRFMLQKRLKGAGLSTGGATFSRFLFAAPLAVLTVAGLMAATGQGLPGMPAAFWGFALMGGVAQIAGTLCTVALFGMRNFAVGLAFTKTEVVQVALFAFVFLGEAVTATGFFAILVGLVGVVLLSIPPREIGGGVLNRATALGLLGGAAFAISATGYRGASLALADGGVFFRAAVTLAAVTLMQTAIMAALLGWREPGEIGRVARAWRATALVGLTGMLGSLGWFTAFTLQHAAYVRALGQVELVLGLLATALVFRERIAAREVLGMLALVASIVALILYL